MQTIVFILLTTTGLSLTYPVFGTKRYQRANFVSPEDMQSLPIYTSVPQYYDSSYNTPYLPISSSASASSAAASSPSLSSMPLGASSASNYPKMQIPISTNGFLDESNYYFLPRQEQYRYGLPTYHGEYKPKQYYYADGPSYSYSDDRLEIANPLDDLHEEMLHEHERDRVTQDILAPIIGQETWYQNPSRSSDSLANANAAFIRNLILYNNEVNNMHEARKHQSGQMPQQLQQLASPNYHMGEYDDYEETEADDWYDAPINVAHQHQVMQQPHPVMPQQQQQPQAPVQPFGLSKVMPPQVYRVQNSNSHHDNHHDDDDDEDDDEDDENDDDDNDSGENEDEDDEEVRELKSLTNQHKSYQHPQSPAQHHHQQQHSRPQQQARQHQQQKQQQQQQKQQQQQQQYQQKQKQQQLQQLQQMQQLQEQQELLMQQQMRQQRERQQQQPIHKPMPQFQQPQQQYQQMPQERQMKSHTYNDQQDWQSDSPYFNAYDTYPEYEDEPWINWDRKRNVQPKKDFSIFENNLRKPTINFDHTKKSVAAPTGKTGETGAVDPKPSPAATTLTTSAPSASTTRPTGIPTTKQLIQFHMHKGQKEVVLPRPAVTLNQQFSEPAVLALTRTEEELKRTTNKSGNIYDTIKEIIAMEQNLEKKNTDSKARLQKRYVTSEQSLAKQLEGLKRRMAV